MGLDLISFFGMSFYRVFLRVVQTSFNAELLLQDLKEVGISDRSFA